MVEVYQIIAGSLIAMGALILYSIIGPRLMTGRRRMNPFIIGQRGNPILIDEVDGFQGEVVMGERLDEVSFRLTVNVGKYIPKWITPRYKYWELEPMDLFQALCDANPPRWIRRKNKNGTTTAISEEAKRQEVRRNLENPKRTLYDSLDAIKELLGTAKRATEPPATE